MHTRFGAQPAKGVVPIKFDGRAFNASDFTRRTFNQLGFKALRLAPAQVHPQQHFSPILRFGATRPRLNIEISVVLVNLAREHAAKLQLI